MHEILRKYFGNPERVLALLYANAGLKTSGYGVLSGGYGGGVDINDYHAVLWLDGFMSGIAAMNVSEAHNILKALNQTLIERYPGEVNEKNCPFINLTEATI